MARLYGSFLVRCWRLHDDRQRIELEHIQTGTRSLVTSMVDAIVWMGGRLGSEADPEAPGRGRNAESSGRSRKKQPPDYPKQHRRHEDHQRGSSYHE